MSFNWRYASGVNIASGDGQFPDERFFQNGRSVWQGYSIHDNPRFCKYDWKIWTPDNLIPRESTFDRLALRKRREEPVLAFAKAMDEAQRHYQAGTPMIILSIQRKRISPDTPWDASRIDLDKQAIAYDEDADPDFHGHR